MNNREWNRLEPTVWEAGYNGPSLTTEQIAPIMRRVQLDDPHAMHSGHCIRTTDERTARRYELAIRVAAREAGIAIESSVRVVNAYSTGDAYRESIADTMHGRTL